MEESGGRGIRMNHGAFPHRQMFHFVYSIGAGLPSSRDQDRSQVRHAPLL